MNALKILLTVVVNLFIHSSNLLISSNASSDLSTIPLDIFMALNSEVSYQKCFNKTPFSFKPFPLSIGLHNHPNTGYFDETYILKIPNAAIQSSFGFVIYNNQIVLESIWKQRLYTLNILHNVSVKNIIPVHGKVAVITQSAYYNYWHWLSEVLCRLALLELQNIEYDFLFVNQESKFMKDTLKLWGIDSSKIIQPIDHSFSIQTDEVILPSMISNTNLGFVLFSCYTQPHLLRYVQEKLLTAALKQNPTTAMSKRIFISRKDSSIRNIINEDEIFNLLQPYGFKRYELAKLSVVDQIRLFHQADIIVSPQGTGLANSIFCNKDVKIIELFQGLNDATFWYLSQELKLNYHAIQTTEFTSDYMQAWQTPTYMPPEVVPVIAQLIQ